MVAKGVGVITKPVWDLYRDGVTQGLLGKFVVCRERLRLSMVEGLSPVSPREALEFGSAFHLCLEHVAKGGGCDGLRKILNSFLASKKGLSPTDQQDMISMLRTVESTFVAYHEFWKQYDQRMKYVLQEYAFDDLIEVPGFRSIRLRGRVDAAYMEGQELWLMENKTKGRIDEDGLKSTLQQDMQTMFYSLALERKFGRNVDGVLYNVIRRTQLRQKVKETENQFTQRIKNDIEARPAFYFMRWKTQLMPGDVETWKRMTLMPILTHICRWWESIKANPFNPWETESEDQIPKINVEHFQRPFGVYDSDDSSGRGDFFELLTKKSYYGLYRRKHPFPELESE